MKYYDSKDDKHKVEMKIIIKKDFFTLHGLAYFLVDINSAIAIVHKLFLKEKFPEKGNPFTSRKTINKFKDRLIIKSYKSGSFIMNVVASILATLILKYIEKLSENKSSQQKQINSNNHFKVTNIQTNEANNIFINKTVKNTSGDPEKDVPYMLNEINRFANKDIYDTNAQRLLIDTLNRIEGSIIDIHS